MTYKDAVLATSGLVYYWRLNEASGNAAPTVGGVTGSVFSATRGVTGLLTRDTDTAFQFNGSSDYISFGNIGSFTGTNPFSLEVLIKQTASGATSFPTILSKESGGDWSLYVDQSLGKFSFMRKTGTGTSTYASGGTPANGSIFHLVATYDGSNQRLYVNGVLSATTANAGTAQTSTSSFQLGRANTATDYFPGVIDEPAIYNVALSQATITAHYNQVTNPTGGGGRSFILW